MKFIKDESGATAIEYGLIALLIAVAIIGVLVTLGPAVTSPGVKAFFLKLCGG